MKHHQAFLPAGRSSTAGSLQKQLILKHCLQVDIKHHLLVLVKDLSPSDLNQISRENATQQAMSLTARSGDPMTETTSETIKQTHLGLDLAESMQREGFSHGFILRTNQDIPAGSFCLRTCCKYPQVNTSPETIICWICIPGSSDRMPFELTKLNPGTSNA